MKVQKSACIHTSVCDNSFQVNSELFYSTKGIQTGRKLKKKIKSQRYLTFSLGKPNVSAQSELMQSDLTNVSKPTMHKRPFLCSWKPV